MMPLVCRYPTAHAAPPCVSLFSGRLDSLIGAIDQFEAARVSTASPFSSRRIRHFKQTLLDFLGALPVERCGAWPVSGWQGVVTEAGAATRLTNLIEEWAASGKKSPLANAAATALEVSRE